VHDAADLEPRLDLALAPDDEFTWTADGLELTGASANSLVAADRVLDAFDDSGEFTFDVWLTPGEQLADELVRLVSLDSGTRGLILGIWDSSYVAQFAVDSADPVTGHPALEAFDRVQLGRSTHLVLTRSKDGIRRIYVDGVLREQSRAPGRLDWESTRMLLGDAPSGGRNFVGTLHRVAIHSVALDPIEVAASFHAGPR
jgi:hypothetical protein